MENITSELVARINLPTAPIIDSSVLELFAQYDWPGNIRELKSVLERTLIHTRGGPITPDLIKFEKKEQVGDAIASHQSGAPSDLDSHQALANALVRFYCLPADQRRFHLKALFVEICGRQAGAVTYIAEVLGTTDETVRKELKAANAGKGEKNRPRKKAHDEMIPKIKEYLIQNL